MSINITGPASAAVYQQALFSITYLNTADEPTKDPPRRVEMRVFDGMFYSNIATGFVNISLVDDNRLMITCPGGLPTFTEEAPSPLLVADSLMISDRDTNQLVNSATVVLDNAQVGDEIAIDMRVAGGLTVNQTSGRSVMISGQATTSQYQVSTMHAIHCDAVS